MDQVRSEWKQMRCACRKGDVQCLMTHMNNIELTQLTKPMLKALFEITMNTGDNQCLKPLLIFVAKSEGKSLTYIIDKYSLLFLSMTKNNNSIECLISLCDNDMKIMLNLACDKNNVFAIKVLLRRNVKVSKRLLNSKILELFYADDSSKHVLTQIIQMLLMTGIDTRFSDNKCVGISDEYECEYVTSDIIQTDRYDHIGCITGGIIIRPLDAKYGRVSGEVTVEQFRNKVIDCVVGSFARNCY